MLGKEQLFLKALGSLSGSAVSLQPGPAQYRPADSTGVVIKGVFASGSVFILEAFDASGRLKQINKQSCHVCSKEMR